MAVTSTSDNRTGVPRLLRTVESHSTVMSSGYRGIGIGIFAPFAGSTGWTTVRHSARAPAELTQTRSAFGHRRKNTGGFRTASQHRFSGGDPVTALDCVGALDCGSRTPDPLVQRFGEVGQPRRLVDSIADNGVFVTLFGADVSGEHRPCRHADPEVDQR